MKKKDCNYSIVVYPTEKTENFPLSFQPFYVAYVNSSIHGEIVLFESDSVYVCLILRKKLGLKFAHLISEIYSLSDESIDYINFYSSLQAYFSSHHIVALFPPQHLHNYGVAPEKAQFYDLGIINLRLNTSLDNLFLHFKPVYRRHIKSAQKDGVEIEIGMHLFDEFYRFYESRMLLNNAVYDRKEVLQKIVDKAPDHVICAIAKMNGKIEAVILNMHNNDCAYYMWGASGIDSHNGSFRLLHWVLIQHYHQLGIKNYSLGGYRLEGNKNKKQENLENFKLGFGASIVQGVHFIWILKPFHYYLYKKVSLVFQYLRK